MALSRIRTAILACLAVALTSPLAAQQKPTLRVYGGGYTPLKDLTVTGPATDFATSFDVGAGIAIPVNPMLALRGSFTYARSELRVGGVETGTEFNRFFYGGDLQLRYPSPGGFTPYLFGGAGAVTVAQRDVEDASDTKFGGRFGLGFEFRRPASKVGLFAEATGWAYKIRDFQGPLAGIDRAQLDLMYNAGLSFAF